MSALGSESPNVSPAAEPAGTRSSFRLGILGDSESPYVKQLLKAAEIRQVEAACLAFSELVCEIRGTEQSSSLSQFDAVLVRGMPLGSLEQVVFRMDCLQAAKDADTLIVNAPRTLETAIDKWLTLHRLQQAGLPVPATIACQTRAQALQAWETLGGDVVVKPVFGGEGRGMMRVADKDLAWRVFSTLQQTQSVMYLQQFIPHLGFDIRVLLIGEEAFAIRRRAAANDWRTNVSQGSTPLAYEPSAEELAMARLAAKSVTQQQDGDSTNFPEGQVLGIDLLPCQDGVTRVLEVNAVPGWKGLAQALQVDVAGMLVEYLMRLVQSR